MQGSKLLDLLKTFEKEDWIWFRKFLLSPYFNNREDVVDLFDYLRKQAPEFKEMTIRKEKVFKKIFPSQLYNEKQISYSMNFLLNNAERFLAQREIEACPPLVNNYLLKSLVNRHLDKHYKYQFDKSKKTLKTHQNKNINYYLFNYQLAEIGDSHFANQNLRRYDSHLQSTYDNLHQFYFISILKQSCEMLTRKKVYGAEYQLNFTNQVVSFLENIDNDNPLISIYFNLFNTFNDEIAETSFMELKKLFEQHQDEIPISEKRVILGYAINFCIFQIDKNVKRKYYAEQSLELYLTGIHQEFLFTNNKLSPWIFKNVVKLGLNLKKYSFAEEFIQKYHKTLEEEFQEDVLHFNLADINYRKKNYHIAQSHLIQVQFSDVFYNLGAKAMLLKIYYETNEVEALLSLIASFSIYLRRNKKIAKETREAYLNFTTFLSKIVRAQKEKLPSVIEKINSTKRLYNRNWLLEICKTK